MTGNYSGFWKKNSQCLITCPLDLFLSYLFMPPKYSVHMCVCLSWVYFRHFFFIILIMYKNKGTKLNSCIQFIRDAIGDSKSEEEILFALKQTKCDPESAIDFLLSNQREKKEKQQKSEIIVTGNIFSNHD